ncbi:MAG: RluA family pseudouridine synthase [Eubacterium sp.]|jgi:23S rRNA pseudouridine1911/1915/1917 synthase|nr:RluA family pseudouridine synthase [Eubacterium sp.]
MNILYEDQHILVCVKPPGTAVQTKLHTQQDMVSLLKNYRHKKGEPPYIGLIHRLDQPVEGILVFGKQAESAAKLCRALTQGGFFKGYAAVTQGAMPAAEGTLVDYLKKDGRNNLSAIVSSGDAKAKQAKLHYRVLETDADSSPVQNLVKIRLLTGRHHQIRVQMAHIGTPLVGDTKYGMPHGEGTPTAGLGLCACELSFVHPVTCQKMQFAIVPSQPVFQKFRALKNVQSCQGF